MCRRSSISLDMAAGIWNGSRVMSVGNSVGIERKCEIDIVKSIVTDDYS